MILLLILGLISAISAGCTRDAMSYGVDYYVWSQTQAQIGLLPVIDNVPYTQNRKNMSFIQGIIGQCCIVLDWNATFYDTEACTAFAELVSLGTAKPFQIGMRFKFEKMKGGYDGTGGDDDLVITKMDSVVTTTGDWLFNASASLEYYEKEKPWDIIPEAKRDSRDTLKAAADTYADRFADTSVEVPFATPCCRIEGGASTCANANETSLNTCTKGFPNAEQKVNLTDRTYVIDEEKGVVQVSMSLAGLADSHLFRIEEGKLRGVHTMTACGDSKCSINNETSMRKSRKGEMEAVSLNV